MTARRVCDGPITSATRKRVGRTSATTSCDGGRRAPRRGRAMANGNSMIGGLVTALIYTRVSTDEQAREGLSLDAQLADCRRYAAGLGWVLGAEYQDVLKGKIGRASCRE